MTARAGRRPAGPIAEVMVRVEDPESASAAWREAFGWQDRGSGRVGAARATVWGAPAATGASWWGVGPPSGAVTAVRFVAGPPVGDLAPLWATGWAAVELLVANADETALGLAGTPFRVLAPPRPLGGDDRLGIRALQVVGPGGEVVYLTEIGPAADPRLPRARCPVDRPFVVVAGARDAAASLAQHAAALGTDVPPLERWPVDVLNDAFGLDRRTRHPLATLRLEGGCLVEVDGYPPAARSWPITDHLVPGIAVVAVHGDGPARSYRGPDGEVVELVPRRWSASSS